MDLGQRNYAVLQVVVEAYIHNAQPVSSGAILKWAPDMNVSPATVRATMAELETAGLLRQPHTSSGRIPTERGLRVYLDRLQCPTSPGKVRRRDRDKLDSAVQDTRASAVPAQLGQVLSGLSGHVAVLAVPRFWGSRWREIGLARCDSRKFLVYFVSPNGLVQQRLLEMAFDLSPDELTHIQNYLNDRLAMRSFAEVRALVAQEAAMAAESSDRLRQQAAAMGQRIMMEGGSDGEMDLFVQGTSHLLEQPEFADLRKVREVLRAVEEKEALLRLVGRILDHPGVQVMLGSDHHLTPTADVACLGCTWSSAAGNKTAISLLGPSRMDYGRLVPLVAYASEAFGRFWEKL